MTVTAAQQTFATLSPEGRRVADAFAAAVAARQAFDRPYRHYLLENVFPADVSDELATLPFAPPVLNGVSGKRELHNDQRSYFDSTGVARFPVMRGVAEAFQSREIVRLIHEAFDAPIDDTFVRQGGQFIGRPSTPFCEETSQAPSVSSELTSNISSLLLAPTTPATGV